MTVLTAHIGHRCVLLDERRLRCVDCTHTVVLPTGAGSTSTSQSPIPGPGDPRCPQHPTEHAGGCRTCAADVKGRADDTPPVVHQPTADVPARAAEARAQLRTTTPRTDPAKPQVTPYDDSERMAAARAELAARQPIPLPDPEPAP